MQEPISWAKLDTYDYSIDEYPRGRVVINIPVDAVNDVVVADLSTAITSNDGYIYVEGRYLVFEKIRIVKGSGVPYVAVITTHKFEGEYA